MFARLKAFATDWANANILTEENLVTLVRLANEEIEQANNEYEDRLAAIDGQLQDLMERLHKLQSDLETGNLEVEDLVPRIKEIQKQIDELEGKRLEMVESIRNTKVELLEAPAVKANVEDPRSLLSKGYIVEQESFLRFFVK